MSLILAFSLGVLAAVGAYFYVVGEYVIGDVDLYEYIKTEIVPNAILAITAISGLCIAAIPVVKRVDATLCHFDSATENVKKTVASDDKIVKKVEAHTGELSAIKDEVLGAVKEIRLLKKELLGEIAVTERHVENIEEIVHIGFEEDLEYVKRGIAARIAKVGGEDDEREKE